MTTEYKEHRYADSIETSDGKWVRISTMNPNATIKIGPRRVRVRVGDIPMNVATLTCGEILRGIAFTEGNVVFCEKHQVDEIVEFVHT